MKRWVAWSSAVKVAGLSGSDKRRGSLLKYGMGGWRRNKAGSKVRVERPRWPGGGVRVERPRRPGGPPPRAAAGRARPKGPVSPAIGGHRAERRGGWGGTDIVSKSGKAEPIGRPRSVCVGASTYGQWATRREKLRRCCQGFACAVDVGLQRAGGSMHFRSDSDTCVSL